MNTENKKYMVYSISDSTRNDKVLYVGYSEYDIERVESRNKHQKINIPKNGFNGTKLGKYVVEELGDDIELLKYNVLEENVEQSRITIVMRETREKYKETILNRVAMKKLSSDCGHGRQSKSQCNICSPRICFHCENDFSQPKIYSITSLKNHLKTPSHTGYLRQCEIEAILEQDKELFKKLLKDYK